MRETAAGPPVRFKMEEKAAALPAASPEAAAAHLECRHQCDSSESTWHIIWFLVKFPPVFSTFGSNKLLIKGLFQRRFGGAWLNMEQLLLPDQGGQDPGEIWTKTQHSFYILDSDSFHVIHSLARSFVCLFWSRREHEIFLERREALHSAISVMNKIERRLLSLSAAVHRREKQTCLGGYSGSAVLFLWFLTKVSVCCKMLRFCLLTRSTSISGQDSIMFNMFTLNDIGNKSLLVSIL